MRNHTAFPLNLIGTTLCIAGETAAGLGFTAPNVVRPNAFDDMTLDQGPRVTAAGEGVFGLVWHGTDFGGFFAEDQIGFTRSLDGGATWEADTLLEKFEWNFGGSALQFPTMDTDGAGTWGVIWEKIDTTGAMNSQEMHFSRSLDNGDTWTPPEVIHSFSGYPIQNNTFPTLATDGAGVWIAVWNSIEEVDGSGSDSDLLFSRSLDNGQNWSAPQVLNSNAIGDTGTDFAPLLRTDRMGNWLLLWTSFSDPIAPAGQSRIVISRSIDNGASWSPAVAINPADQGSLAHVATDGMGRWIAAQAGDPIDITVSTDAGATWSPLVSIRPDDPPLGGIFDSPRIATDGAGNWVVVWSATSTLGGTIGDDPDILVSHSADHGGTWSAPEALNTNAATDTVFSDGVPSIAADGSLHWVAIWLSDGSHLGVTGLNMYHARSRALGVTAVGNWSIFR